MTQQRSCWVIWAIGLLLFLLSGCVTGVPTDINSQQDYNQNFQSVEAAIYDDTDTEEITDSTTYINSNMDFSAIQSVAVLPFQNLTDHEQAAPRVRDSFMGMLLATEAFYVLPPGEVARGINRAGMRTPQAPTVDEVKSISSILEIQAVITGVVREYGSVRSGATEANLVSVSLQMIESQSGAIIWSASSTKGGITTTDRLLGGGGKPMNIVTEQVVNDLLDKLFE